MSWLNVEYIPSLTRTEKELLNLTTVRASSAVCYSETDYFVQDLQSKDQLSTVSYQFSTTGPTHAPHWTCVCKSKRFYFSSFFCCYNPTHITSRTFQLMVRNVGWVLVPRSTSLGTWLQQQPWKPWPKKLVDLTPLRTGIGPFISYFASFAEFSLVLQTHGLSLRATPQTQFSIAAVPRHVQGRRGTLSGADVFHWSQCLTQVCR